MHEDEQRVADDISAQEYASLAALYDTSFQQMPYRTFVEQAAVWHAVGDVSGLRVLDLACGTGHYSRLLRKRGASEVVGVDISTDMVEYAQQVETTTPLGVRYMARDVGTMEVLGAFDLALGVYLLHYATTGDHLDRMCQQIADNLVPGGRFVTDTLNPDLARQPDYYLPYGVAVYASEDMHDGTPYAFAFTIATGLTPALTIHYWSRARTETALKRAGFRDIVWQEARVLPEGEAEHGQAFWAAHEAAPLCVVVSATKAE